MSLLKTRKQLIAVALAAMMSLGGGISAVAASASSVSAASNDKGSIMLDTAQYILAPGNQYTIGAFIKDPTGKQLTPAEIKNLVSQGKLKVRDSRSGSIVTLDQLPSGHFRVTAKNTGTCYIVYDIGGNHASVRIDVQNGVRQHGTAVRNTSYFITNVFNITINNNTPSTPSTPTTSTPSVTTPSSTPAQNKKVNLFDVCNAYDVSAFGSEQDGTSTFHMAGQKYTNGFEVTASDAYKTRASFNVKGAYNTLEFDIGHIDDTKTYNLSLDIFLDGKLVKTIERESDELPTHYTLDIQGVKQIIFYSNGGDDSFDNWAVGEIWGLSARYGLGNMTVS